MGFIKSKHQEFICDEGLVILSTSPLRKFMHSSDCHSSYRRFIMQ